MMMNLQIFESQLPAMSTKLSFFAQPFLGDVNDGFWFPTQASSFAAEADWVYFMILWISVLFFVPMMAFMAYCSWKYAKSKGTKAESQKSHDTPLELAWSILPSFLLVWMFLQGTWSYLDIRTPPDGAYDIGVQAFKWGWTFDYGNGTFHPELHVLKDEPTKLSMRSSDVIHSLFIPAFRVKKDVVPGRYNYMWFQPSIQSETVSESELAAAKAEFAVAGGAWDYEKYQFTPDGYRFYDLFCAEYCGKDHSKMQTVVVVHETQEELDAWIKQYSVRPPGDEPAVYGEKLYNRRGCGSCHSIDGSKRVGPSFQGFYDRQHEFVSGESIIADDNYVRESILIPKAKIVAGYAPVMPSYKGQLSDDDIDSLIAYLKSLSSAASTSESSASGTSDQSAAAVTVESAP